MFELQDALNNKLLFQALKRSEYFQPIYFSRLNTNQATESFTGLRSGNLCFKHTVFFVTASFPDHELIELILEQRSKDIYIEFRNLSSSNKEIPHFKRTEWYNIFVKTTNQIQVWQSIDESKKRQIKSSLQK